MVVVAVEEVLILMGDEEMMTTIHQQLNEKKGKVGQEYQLELINHIR